MRCVDYLYRLRPLLPYHKNTAIHRCHTHKLEASSRPQLKWRTKSDIFTFIPHSRYWRVMRLTLKQAQLNIITSRTNWPPGAWYLNFSSSFLVLVRLSDSSWMFCALNHLTALVLKYAYAWHGADDNSGKCMKQWLQQAYEKTERLKNNNKYWRYNSGEASVQNEVGSISQTVFSE